MNTERVITEYRAKKEARELEIYNEWNRLMAQPGAMVSAANRRIMDKYGIFAQSTVWFIRQRVARRLAEQGLTGENGTI